MTGTVLFLGPSLSRDEAYTLCPGAIVLPPAAVGDVYKVVRDARPTRIALVDGYFERMAAVWHKELLWALEQRVAVYGAASMGALRAAELGTFGMIGVGAIHAAFRAGKLTDDDEVAVAHLPGDRGYAAVSTAMVELRAGLALAQRRRVISPAVHDRLIALGKARFYRERTWAQLVADGAAARIGGRALDDLSTLVAARRPSLDVKAADARTLLRLLARTPAVRPPKPSWKMHRTWFWERFAELVDEHVLSRN
jgi:hypothetical protein